MVNDIVEIIHRIKLIRYKSTLFTISNKTNYKILLCIMDNDFEIVDIVKRIKDKRKIVNYSFFGGQNSIACGEFTNCVGSQNVAFGAYSLHNYDLDGNIINNNNMKNDYLLTKLIKDIKYIRKYPTFKPKIGLIARYCNGFINKMFN